MLHKLHLGKPRVMFAVVGRVAGSLHAIFQHKWQAEEWIGSRDGWIIKRIVLSEKNGILTTQIHAYEFLHTKSND